MGTSRKPRKPGQNGLNDDIYLYSCEDSICETKTQLHEYGHITNVPHWGDCI